MALEKFDFSYNRAWEDEHNFNVLETEFESGKKQYREKSPAPRRFVLQFEKNNRNNNQPQQILDFFNARRGKYEPFKWDYIHSDGTVEELTVRFATNSLNRNILSDTIYTFSIPLEEVL